MSRSISCALCLILVLATLVGTAAAPRPIAAAAIPSLRVEAEDYVNYRDTTPGNTGWAYRRGDVDIQSCVDPATPTGKSCFNVGWITAGEWLEYEVTLEHGGQYLFVARTATRHHGKRFHVEVDGKDVTGTLEIPHTGGWNSWDDAESGPFPLTAGTHILRVVADTDGFNLNFLDLDSPESAPTGDPVLVGAGDIAACDSAGDEATAALLDKIAGTVFTVGDNVYPASNATAYAQCYGPSWGRHKARTRPAAGNHEYASGDVSAYFAYFGASAGTPAEGWYSYDLGMWHIVVLNSNCAKVGGCEPGAPQERWLRADLAAHPTGCTLAYWHHPLFSSGSHGGDPVVQPLWQALYEYGADVVLAGHDHLYERFAPQDPSGTADAAHGLRQFVVGTGGKDHDWAGIPVANSEVLRADTFGVLRLTLRGNGYEWAFVPEQGKDFIDAGSGTCHGMPAATR